MAIVKNTGVIVTDSDPNLITGIATTTESPVSYDSTTETLYKFDSTLTVGNRWVAQQIASAENGLRVTSGKAVVGSDSYTLPKNSALTAATYFHTGTQAFSFVGDYYGTPMTNLKMESTGILRFNAESDAVQFGGSNFTGRVSTDYGNFFFSMAGSTPQLTGWYTSSLATIIGGSEHNMTDAQASAILGGVTNTITSHFAGTIGGQKLTVNSSYMIAFGRENVSFTGQSASTWVGSDLAFAIGNAAGSTYNSNAVTVLKNGKTQINALEIALTAKTQAQCTPSAALDVVSTTSGTLAPRLTSAQVTTLLATLNLTTDITGGTPGNAYSKKGMEVECTDCTSLDESTAGVTLKLYPNAALTAWVAKKLW